MTVNQFNVSEYGANTCIRMAYKAFSMEFPFSMGDIDPTIGTIAASQKKKFDELTGWVDSPFHEYQCNKCRNHFVMAKKHQRIRCVKCIKKMGNAACSNKMCKQCCTKYSDVACKTHSNRCKSNNAGSKGGDVIATASAKVNNIVTPGLTGTIEHLNNDLGEVVVPAVLPLKHRVPASEEDIEDVCMC